MEDTLADTSKQIPEYKFLYLGPRHRDCLFDKLFDAAEKYERHVQYVDVWYLTLTVDGQKVIVELHDPGLAHTGAREMAIRQTEAAILCYTAYNGASFNDLAHAVEDFKQRSKLPPVLLFCNEDDVLEEATSIADHSSSEGYESDDGSGHRSPWGGVRNRRRSMEQIVASHDVNGVSREQGEGMARLLSPTCQFMSASLSQVHDTRFILENMIRQINAAKSPRTKSFFRRRAPRISPSLSIEPPSFAIEPEPSTTASRSLPFPGVVRRKSNFTSQVCTIS